MSDESHSTVVGSFAPDFELPGVDGGVYHLTRFRESLQGVGVVFMNNQCPVVKGYLDRLNAIQAEFRPHGVSLIGINSNDVQQEPADSFEQMKIFAAAAGLTFPYLCDLSQDVAQGFQAMTFPEVYLLDGAGMIQYYGAIDDQPDDATAVQQPYLRHGILALLGHEPIAPAQTMPQGCPIRWRQD